MDQETTTMQPVKEAEREEIDVFAWANNLFEYKEDLKTELFIFTKNYIPYHTKIDAQLQRQLQPLLVDGLLEHVLDGAGAGMVVRGFEDAEEEENVLQRTDAKNVENLASLMNWIKTQESELELFVEEEHELKRMKGILVRFTHAGMKPFYVIKLLPRSQVLKGEGAWIAKGNSFRPLDASAALRIPADNQLLLIGDDLFVFNQTRLDQIFGYNAKKNSIALKKVAQIEANFKLSFADGLDFQTAVKGSKALINKLQKFIPGNVNQDQLIEHAEELGLDLMADENGAIILMNERDVKMFINLLNDDYIESSLTGQKYEIQRKKLLKITEDSSDKPT